MKYFGNSVIALLSRKISSPIVKKIQSVCCETRFTKHTKNVCSLLARSAECWRKIFAGNAAETNVDFKKRRNVFKGKCTPAMFGLMTSTLAYSSRRRVLQRGIRKVAQHKVPSVRAKSISKCYDFVGVAKCSSQPIESPKKRKPLELDPVFCSGQVHDVEFPKKIRRLYSSISPALVSLWSNMINDPKKLRITHGRHYSMTGAKSAPELRWGKPTNDFAPISPTMTRLGILKNSAKPRARRPGRRFRNGKIGDIQLQPIKQREDVDVDATGSDKKSPEFEEEPENQPEVENVDEEFDPVTKMPKIENSACRLAYELAVNKLNEELEGKVDAHEDLEWTKQKLVEKAKQKNKEAFWETTQRKWNSILGTNVSDRAVKVEIKKPKKKAPSGVINDVLILYDRMKEDNNDPDYQVSLTCAQPIPVSSVESSVANRKKTKRITILDLILNKKGKFQILPPILPKSWPLSGITGDKLEAPPWKYDLFGLFHRKKKEEHAIEYPKHKILKVKPYSEEETLNNEERKSIATRKIKRYQLNPKLVSYSKRKPTQEEEENYEKEEERELKQAGAVAKRRRAATVSNLRRGSRGNNEEYDDEKGRGGSSKWERKTSLNRPRYNEDGSKRRPDDPKIFDNHPRVRTKVTVFDDKGPIKNNSNKDDYDMLPAPSKWTDQQEQARRLLTVNQCNSKSSVCGTVRREVFKQGSSTQFGIGGRKGSTKDEDGRARKDHSRTSFVEYDIRNLISDLNNCLEPKSKKGDVESKSSFKLSNDALELLQSRSNPKLTAKGRTQQKRDEEDMNVDNDESTASLKIAKSRSKFPGLSKLPRLISNANFTPHKRQRRCEEDLNVDTSAKIFGPKSNSEIAVGSRKALNRDEEDLNIDNDETPSAMKLSRNRSKLFRHQSNYEFTGETRKGLRRDEEDLNIDNEETPASLKVLYNKSTLLRPKSTMEVAVEPHKGLRRDEEDLNIDNDETPSAMKLSRNRSKLFRHQSNYEFTGETRKGLRRDEEDLNIDNDETPASLKVLYNKSTLLRPKSTMEVAVEPHKGLRRDEEDLNIDNDETPSAMKLSRNRSKLLKHQSNLEFTGESRKELKGEKDLYMMMKRLDTSKYLDVSAARNSEISSDFDKRVDPTGNKGDESANNVRKWRPYRLNPKIVSYRKPLEKEIKKNINQGCNSNKQSKTHVTAGNNFEKYDLCKNIKVEGKRLKARVTAPVSEEKILKDNSYSLNENYPRPVSSYK